MERFLKEPPKQTGNTKVFLIAALIGIVVVGTILGLVSLKKSTQQIQVDAMANAYREGSPEFERYTKKIVAETNEERTTQSPTGMGTVMMSIHGRIRNITGKTLTGLELKIGVVDSFGNVIKEKTTVVIPKEVETLEHNGVLPVQTTIEGFAKDDDRANIRWKVIAIKVQE
jgi:hypothetical protein